MLERSTDEMKCCSSDPKRDITILQMELIASRSEWIVNCVISAFTASVKGPLRVDNRQDSHFPCPHRQWNDWVKLQLSHQHHNMFLPVMVQFILGTEWETEEEEEEENEFNAKYVLFIQKSELRRTCCNMPFKARRMEEWHKECNECQFVYIESFQCNSGNWLWRKRLLDS